MLYVNLALPLPLAIVSNVALPAPLLIPVTFAYVPGVLLPLSAVVLDNTKNALASLPNEIVCNDPVIPLIASLFLEVSGIISPSTNTLNLCWSLTSMLKLNPALEPSATTVSIFPPVEFSNKSPLTLSNTIVVLLCLARLLLLLYPVYIALLDKILTSALTLSSNILTFEILSSKYGGLSKSVVVPDTISTGVFLMSL